MFNKFKDKSYNLEGLTLDKSIIIGKTNLFWKYVFTPLHAANNNIHLSLLCKVQFTDESLGFRSLGDVRKVNFTDKELFQNFITERLGLLSDAYTVHPISRIIFSYIEMDGLASGDRLLIKQPEYEVTTHVFSNLQLPLTMDPNLYGRAIVNPQVTDNITRYVVSNERFVFVIDSNKTPKGIINNVTVEGVVDIKWIDTQISDNTFKRVFNTKTGHDTFYITNGEIVFKEKELSAKPFKSVSIDKSKTSDSTFMTIDIEVLRINDQFEPYLICGYTDGKYINSYRTDITKGSKETMFRDLINQMLEFKNIKYIYAHNLSGFDGIFLLKHLIIFKGAKVEPLMFNGKIISIKFIYNQRTIVFKDSYLLLPYSLRALCKSFNIPSQKGHFPFLLQDINYIGDFPAFEYWTNTTREEHLLLKEQFGDKIWNFKEESIKYCNLDCLCLFEVLSKFNELVFVTFKHNVHKSLTLPALAMRIYKSQYMPKNTLYQLLGFVEQDIREAYTGGAVDVFIPHNRLDKDPANRKRVRLYLYDVNALYPTIMAKIPMPVGKPIAFVGDITKFEKQPFGFFYCNITTPEFLEHPLLQRRMNTPDGVRTIAGLGSWTGWVFSVRRVNEKCSKIRLYI